MRQVKQIRVKGWLPKGTILNAKRKVIKGDYVLNFTPMNLGSKIPVSGENVELGYVDLPKFSSETALFLSPDTLISPAILADLQHMGTVEVFAKQVALDPFHDPVMLMTNTYVDGYVLVMQGSELPAVSLSYDYSQGETNYELRTDHKLVARMLSLTEPEWLAYIYRPLGYWPGSHPNLERVYVPTDVIANALAADYPIQQTPAEIEDAPKFQAIGYGDFLIPEQLAGDNKVVKHFATAGDITSDADFWTTVILEAKTPTNVIKRAAMHLITNTTAKGVVSEQVIITDNSRVLDAEVFSMQTIDAALVGDVTTVRMSGLIVAAPRVGTTQLV